GIIAATPEELLLLDPVTDGVARVRDQTGKVRLSAQVPAGAEISNIAVSPNRKGLVIAWITHPGFPMRLYDSSGRERIRFPDLHGGHFWSLTFSPDGAQLASASDDGTAQLWDVATGQPIGGP